MKALGQQVKKMRLEKKMTQEDLAFKADIAFSSVARIEAGKLNTSISTIVRLANALEIDKRSLLDF